MTRQYFKKLTLVRVWVLTSGSGFELRTKINYSVIERSPIELGRIFFFPFYFRSIFISSESHNGIWYFRDRNTTFNNNIFFCSLSCIQTDKMNNEQFHDEVYYRTENLTGFALYRVTKLHFLFHFLCGL